jgi:hypothetical protein
MGFRRAIVPVGSVVVDRAAGDRAAGDRKAAPGKAGKEGAPGTASHRGSTGRTLKVASDSGGIEVVEVEDLQAAVQAALLD